MLALSALELWFIRDDVTIFDDHSTVTQRGERFYRRFLHILSLIS